MRGKANPIVVSKSEVRLAVSAFLSKVLKTKYCWLWQGQINPFGYGQMRWHSVKVYAHRLAYVLYCGHVPVHMDIDHLCRNRSCVNPEHLEVVTRRTNLLRGIGKVPERANQTHCKRGHPLSGNNLVISHGRWRECRTCRDIGSKNSARKRYALKRSKGVCYKCGEASSITALCSDCAT